VLPISFYDIFSVGIAHLGHFSKTHLKVVPYELCSFYELGPTDKDQARRDKSENVVEKLFCDGAAFLNWAQLILK